MVEDAERRHIEASVAAAEPILCDGRELMKFVEGEMKKERASGGGRAKARHAAYEKVAGRIVLLCERYRRGELIMGRAVPK